MIDVLVYLFEQYYQGDAYPDQDTLTRRLTAAGFGHEDISEALTWLRGLAEREKAAFPTSFQQSDSFRAYTTSELAKLAPEARGFIAFLESAGVLAPAIRELIVEQAMAVQDDVVELSKLKIIVLIVLWTQRGNVDAIVLDELLPDGAARILH
jgi:Smg protein